MTREQELEQILRDLLPLYSSKGGGCWYCRIGNKPDSDLIHFDHGNCWGGNRECLWHPKYERAREVLRIKKADEVKT